MKTTKKAFTIVELLVALGITAMLITLMLTITVNVLNAWNQSSGTLMTSNQARFVLDQIERDFDGIIIKRDGGKWLAATIQQDQTGLNIRTVSGISMAAGDANYHNDNGTLLSMWNPANPKPDALNTNHPSFRMDGKLEDCRFGQGGVWLRFFTATTNSIAGDNAPCAIGYQIIRGQVRSAKQTTAETSHQYSWLLFRSQVGAENTFKAGFDIIYNVTGEDEDNDGKICYERGNANASGGQYPGNIRRPPRTHIIANDVVDFGVRIFARLNANDYEEEIFPRNRDKWNSSPYVPPSSGFPYTYIATSDSSVQYSERGNRAASTITGIPVAAEVMVRILTPQGAKLLAAYENGNLTSSETWWDIVEKHSNVYTRRISLKTTGI
jgi:type II secretory pathway pseudopilin PulG